MHILTVQQPWATLLSRGHARFAVRHDATAYRGTVAIRAGAEVDHEVVARLADEPDFAERLASFGINSAADLNALPRDTFVGVAAVADLWGFTALEEIATEDDAILLGEVSELAVFWELVEAVAISPIADPIADLVADDVADNAMYADEPDGEVDGSRESEHGDDDDADADADDDADAEADDDAVHARPIDPPMVAVSDEVAARIREAVLHAGARFDDDDLVFWPVVPSDALAVLIGSDAVGDREITRRVWAHVLEHDLQDAEDHTYVYLDDALRMALDTNEEGMSTVEFTSLVVAQMLHAERE